MEFCFQSGQCDKIIEGEVRVGGQEHFYLEPNSSVIWTLDSGNEVHMVSSTQVWYTSFSFLSCMFSPIYVMLYLFKNDNLQ